MAQVWLQFPPERFGGLPEELTYDVFTPDRAPEGIEEVEVFVPPYTPSSPYGPLLEQMTSLRLVQAPSAGVDALLPYRRDGVTLCRAAGVHDPATAEMAVALVLASLRDLPGLVDAQRRHSWEQDNAGPTLADRRVLVVGYGSIGKALHRRLDGFECSVTAVASRARDEDGVHLHGIDELPALLPEADVVVLLTPLTDATRGLFDAPMLARMPDGALLVNMARGPVVDTDALLAETARGRLRAALDVTDPEPLPADHPLWDAPGVLVSAHSAGGREAMWPRFSALLREQLRRYVTGEPPLHAVP